MKKESTEALIARFARMSSDSSDHMVAGRYSLTGDQMDMFDSLKKRFLERVCNMKMHSYENFSTFLNRKISKIDNAWDDFNDFLGNIMLMEMNILLEMKVEIKCS